jgi:MYXO-CTERM domain-containing protein
VTLAVWLALLPAYANGQTTHVWITREALHYLEDGDLRDLLTRDDLKAALLNGAMFPDGGYAVDHGYGEHAHWFEFQSRYRDWIIDSFEPEPWSDEAAWHVAFLMGMVSHGMADQAFDAMYFDWSRTYDAEFGWAEGVSFDEASDVIWAALTSPQEVPPREIPGTLFVSLYQDHGVTVSEETMQDGQTLLGFAIEIVGLLSENPDTVLAYQQDFPWGGAHLLQDLPGSPSCEAQLVAGLWQEWWDQLHQRVTPLSVIGVAPTDGHVGLETAMSSPEARLQVIFARGVTAAEVQENVIVTDQEGHVLATTAWVTYGDGRNVAHLAPLSDWPENTELLVTAQSGLTSVDGSQLAQAVTWRVSTWPPQTPEVEDAGCGCTSGRRPMGFAWALLALAGLRRRPTTSTT